jgi:hypothetical protein
VMSWCLRFVGATTALLVFSMALWVAAYPGRYDPKNFRYVLWKAGVYSMDLDGATAVMVHDAGARALVVGKTRRQLRNRFGVLLPLEQVTPYLRRGHELYWKDKEVLFIRRSPWMIVFNGDRAVDLVLMKGY